MSAGRIVVTVIFIIVCLITILLVFQGKGKGADLSGGLASREMETYFSTHGKKYTENAMLEKGTAIACVVFIVLALLLNMSWGY